MRAEVVDFITAQIEAGNPVWKATGTPFQPVLLIMANTEEEAQQKADESFKTAGYDNVPDIKPLLLGEVVTNEMILLSEHEERS